MELAFPYFAVQTGYMNGHAGFLPSTVAQSTKSNLAQRKRAGLITRRSLDRNEELLNDAFFGPFRLAFIFWSLDSFWNTIRFLVGNITIGRLVIFCKDCSTFLFARISRQHPTPEPYYCFRHLPLCSLHNTAPDTPVERWGALSLQRL
jgi:hypothetical protein